MGKLIALDVMAQLSDLQRASRKIVLAHGCFDLFHLGHLRHLREAASHGTLYVTLTASRHIAKGPGRPFFSDAERAEMLEALDFVECVGVVHSPSAVPAIAAVRPNVYAVGHDAKLTDAEAKELRNSGGTVLHTRPSRLSSTLLLTGQAWRSRLES